MTTTNTPRDLTADEVTFTVDCLPENTDPRDEIENAETSEQIVNDLIDGNPWAWCCVRVTAEWEGFEGEVYLGGV